MSHRKPRPLPRDERCFRDARLFIIATEGSECEPRYFSIVRSSRVKLHVLACGEGRSAPNWIYDQLSRFKSDFETAEDDEFWYVGDVDHHTTGAHVRNLKTAVQQAMQAGFSLAISNPCFELWLLLHFEDVPDDASTVKLEERLRACLGGYSKSAFALEPFNPSAIGAAIDRARALDADSSDR